MKVTKQNFRVIREVAYNLSGLEYYLHLPFSICDFWHVLKFIRKEIKSGAVYQYPLYNVGKHSFKPYIGNSVNLF